jgi:hypothetical protein
VISIATRKSHKANNIAKIMELCDHKEVGKDSVARKVAERGLRKLTCNELIALYLIVRK